MNHISRHQQPFALIATATVAATIALPATGHADTTGYQFLSPSGNIGCSMLEDQRDGTPFAACKIRDHTWVAPATGYCQRAAVPGAIGEPGPDPMLRQGDAPCMGFWMSQTADPRLGDFPTLDYGQTHSVGTLTCDSKPPGITCTDSSTGHFFRVSRESYQLG